MDKITQALEWAEKRMAGWEPFTKNQMEMLHFAFHELKQLHKPVVGGPASDVRSEGELLAGALAKTVCDGFKECTDVKGIMCKCEGKCELKEETSVAPLEGFYRKKGQ